METNKELKIFLVDDDLMCREMCRQYLVNMGFKDIQLFESGLECVDALGQSPDIILLDHQMTPINGLETLNKIKRHNPDIYIIYLSAQEDMKVAINALKYGAFDYIIKGDNEEEMLKTVIQKIINVMDVLSRQSGSKWPKLFSHFIF